MGEEKMKKFNFKKIGILLAMMLVAGAALVGPASAVGIDALGGGSFSGSVITYYGQAGSLYDSFDRISVSATLLNSGGGSVANTGTYTLSNTNFVSTSSHYYYSAISGTYYTDKVYASSVGPAYSDTAYFRINT
ncbi:hypothetical protein F1737_05850 [Methanoplanus sp. FWC-SCC4]|uniref:Uncharacterized protein n=1 Tax=Methanochimaera problematica TaxID=2609417 RepID=A0AA97FBZ4_9EURY|nr:hypothetical protein [Methanoplanus sp. FWC-SCC4]WOF16267.1 hypothetical protein F1737_05850 [Methanoplanus sp. FWC-SCC4]